ncbi:universal stress protein [Actinoplanes nipponensis]|nr:universal stress protein [Actinoplanes nipponensis]
MLTPLEDPPRPAPAGRPLTVAGRSPGVPTGPVVVALDDDGNPAALLRHGWAVAEASAVPLRVAYVWSDCRPPDCAHHRTCHHDLAEADRLLTALVDANLSVEAAARVERDVLHHPDPVEALIALSAAASMLVIGVSSDRPGPADELGATTRRLLGRTWCPLVVVPHHQLSATRLTW